MSKQDSLIKKVRVIRKAGIPFSENEFETIEWILNSCIDGSFDPELPDFSNLPDNLLEKMIFEETPDGDLQPTRELITTAILVNLAVNSPYLLGNEPTMDPNEIMQMADYLECISGVERIKRSLGPYVKDKITA